jgi:nitroreductase
MELDSIITGRRTVRTYDPSHAMPDDDLHAIIDAARHTPTAFNIQNWRFVAIRDRGVKEKIRRSAWDQQQVGVNSALIAVCADLHAWDQDTDQYWSVNGADTAEHMSRMTRDFYQSRPIMQRDEALRSVGMAATAIMWKAHDLGYRSSPMIGFDHDAVAAAINAPKNVIVGMLIALGKSDDEPYPKTLLARGHSLFYDFFPS